MLRPPLRYLATFGALCLAGPAVAQERPAAPHVSIELNAAAGNEAGCLLSFMVENGHDAAIDSAIYEMVLFDREGQVDRLTLFDFGTLPLDRPRVRQFTLPGTSCETIGRVLVNGASTCKAPDLGDAACSADLAVSSRTVIEVLG